MKTSSPNIIDFGFRLAFLWAGFGSLTAWSEPPKVLSVLPSEGAANVPLVGTGSFSIHFDQPMDKDSVIQALSMTDKQGPTYARSVLLSWRMLGALQWRDDQTLVKDDSNVHDWGSTLPGSHGCAMAAGRTYTVTISPEAKNAAGQPLGSRFSWTFRTRERAFPDKDVPRVLTAAYLKYFRIHIPAPAYIKDTVEIGVKRSLGHCWISTAYLGSSRYRLYLLEDGTCYAAKQETRRPQGTYRAAVVVVDYGDPKLVDTIRTRLPAEEQAYNKKLEEFAQMHGLGRPILRFVNTNIVVSQKEATDWYNRDQVVAAVEHHGFAREDFDLYLCLDLNTKKHDGGVTNFGSDYSHMGWSELTPVGNSSYAGGFHSVFMAGYQHEFGHIFSWEHEWGLTPVERGKTSVDRFPITDPALFGWTDTNGDGVPEILSPSPYGSSDLAQAPDFSLEPQVDTQESTSSGNVSFTIDVKPRGGLNQPVLLTALNPPHPKGAAPNPMKLRISGGAVRGARAAVLTVEADVTKLSPGTYPIVLLGVSGALRHLESVQVKVAAPQ